jgi:hypothetical protein
MSQIATPLNRRIPQWVPLLVIYFPLLLAGSKLTCNDLIEGAEQFEIGFNSCRLYIIDKIFCCHSALYLKEIIMYRYMINDTAVPHLNKKNELDKVMGCPTTAKWWTI